MRLNVRHYGSALKSCQQASQFKAAMELLELMNQYHIKPDLKVYNIAISACARCQETDRAESLFDELDRTDYLQ